MIFGELRLVLLKGLNVLCAGVKCHSHLCHDLFLIYVSHRILPVETFSSSLWLVPETFQIKCEKWHVWCNYWIVVNLCFVKCCTAGYFTLVAVIAAFVGQHIVRKLIIVLGRASLIIFILASTIFASAVSLGKPFSWILWKFTISARAYEFWNVFHSHVGGVGISNMVHKIENHEYMGFENLCKYGS